MFTERAETRVKLGLLVSELVQDLGVRAEPNKVRELIEDIASTYQDPTEVINWYYEDNDQLMGIESRVLEDTVVEKLLEVPISPRKQRVIRMRCRELVRRVSSSLHSD